MITTRVPADWRDLQGEVARILDERGFAAEVEKTVQTVRGSVVVDVFAEEEVNGRRNLILCECKNWTTRVPQSVIHGFKTVVDGSGANVGYIVSSGGFQSGAFTAAELTNLRLVTWEEFQAEFEATWIETFLFAHVVERLGPLLTYTEPLLPRASSDLDDDKRRRFLGLKEKYDPFGWLLSIMFTPWGRMMRDEAVPELPLRAVTTQRLVESGAIPDDVLDAVAYRDLLEAAVPYGEQAIIEFRRVVRTDDDAE